MDTALFYEFETGTPPRYHRVEVHGTHLVRVSDTEYWLHVGADAYGMKTAPRLVSYTGSGSSAPLGPPSDALGQYPGPKPTRLDENGCHTRADGECVSPGPCLHTAPPLDENGCPLPTCPECGAYHEVVRPGKTQPTCLCEAYRVECDNHQETRRQLEVARDALTAAQAKHDEPSL